MGEFYHLKRKENKVYTMIKSNYFKQNRFFMVVVNVGKFFSKLKIRILTMFFVRVFGEIIGKIGKMRTLQSSQNMVDTIV